MTRPLAAVRQGANNVDKRWRDLPLRTRLTTAAALSATLAILAVIAVAYIAVRHELRGQIDKDLRKQSAEVHLNVAENRITGQTTVSQPTAVGEINGYVQALNGAGDVVARPGDPQIPVGARDQHIATNGGMYLRDG